MTSLTNESTRIAQQLSETGEFFCNYHKYVLIDFEAIIHVLWDYLQTQDRRIKIHMLKIRLIEFLIPASL